MMANIFHAFCYILTSILIQRRATESLSENTYNVECTFVAYCE